MYRFDPVQAEEHRSEPVQAKEYRSGLDFLIDRYMNI
tara:strand:- start:810 stop:920 length:111 start_codon:yes stop_codon:yes gene_type:complete